VAAEHSSVCPPRYAHSPPTAAPTVEKKNRGANDKDIKPWPSERQPAALRFTNVVTRQNFLRTRRGGGGGGRRADGKESPPKVAKIGR
jgi:hypothetical protein